MGNRPSASDALGLVTLEADLEVQAALEDVTVPFDPPLVGPGRQGQRRDAVKAVPLDVELPAGDGDLVVEALRGAKRLRMGEPEVEVAVVAAP
jgi:hypothetical protein